ncbi:MULTISPECIES: helix-turn-helix domain-containing protein [Neisseria]|uniref:helix-turn-helix domain-containing protein n=1 Tax=Neisseria TaxID=482 RepID=UPI001EFCBD5F|nr:MULTISPECIES: helix-turn-helix domain-containing protein [Neisseria]
MVVWAAIRRLRSCRLTFLNLWCKQRDNFLHEDLHKRIIQLTLNGVSITGIASALKCSPSTVSKVRRAYNRKHKSGDKDQFDIFKPTLKK